MKKIVLLMTIFAVAINIHSADKKAPTKNSPEVMYAIGYLVGGNLKNQLILQNEDIEFKMFSQGIRDSLLSKPAQVDVEAYKPLVRQRYLEDKKKIMEARKKEQQEYIEKAVKEAKKSDQAIVLANNVIIEILQEGSGDKPVKTDIVKVNYEGKLTNGTIFDSSFKRNQPAEFPLTSVIKCWTDAFQHIKKGAKARLTCPSETAYGSADMGVIPPHSTLIFEVELLDIIKPV